MSFLDQLGIDIDSMTWKDFAACKNVARRYVDNNGREHLYDPVYDSYEQDTAPYAVRKAMDAMCTACPVVEQCMNYGRSGKETGVFGGYYLTDGIPDRQRNSHKTKQVRDALKARGSK